MKLWHMIRVETQTPSKRGARIYKVAACHFIIVCYFYSYTESNMEMNLSSFELIQVEELCFMIEATLLRKEQDIMVRGVM